MTHYMSQFDISTAAKNNGVLDYRVAYLIF